MTQSSFGEALSRLLRDEGGYGNDPRDPGGPTNFGITLADARRNWKADASAADVKAMPQSIAREIYRKRYWDAMRCDDLPDGVDYAVFDYGVNSGVARAGRVLRRKLSLPDSSGAINDSVIAAVKRADAAQLVRAICAERLTFLKSLKTWPVFGRGWTRRVAGVETAALAMVAAGRKPAPLATSASAPAATAIAKLIGVLATWWRARRTQMAKGDM